MKTIRFATITVLLAVMLFTTFAVAVTPAYAFACGTLCPMSNESSRCAPTKQQTWVCAKAQWCVDTVSGMGWCQCTGGWYKWGPCGTCAR